MARLEERVEHIQSDIVEIKGDIRRLDTKLDTKTDSLRDNTDLLRDNLAALAVRMEQGFATLNEKIDRKLAWFIGLILTLVLTLAGGCASGFLWLAAKINEL